LVEMDVSRVALLHGLLGGLLIGAGAATLLLFNGRVAGISGITANAVGGDIGKAAWRLAFLAGLALPVAFVGLGGVSFTGDWRWLALSGLLVGIGTNVGSGCTSGHGVCGLANRSPRSLAATVTFMAVAVLTVYLVRHVLR
jgi:uncharacterized membrane protein YedE/YeeE